MVLEKFSKNITEVWNLKKRERYLIDSLDKTIKEVFRENGLIVYSIKINQFGFACYCDTKNIDFSAIEKINNHFKSIYTFEMEFVECNKVLFKFTEKKK